MILKKIPKKADVHIREMIFMLIGLTIFFSIVLLFFLSFSIANVKKNVQQSTTIGAVLLASGLAGSPELKCPSDLSSSSGLCIDSDKILALMGHSEYSSFWSNDISGLRIEKINPASNKTIVCSSGNYEQCTDFIIMPTKPGKIQEYASYATLCRIESKNGIKYPFCELAKIIVAVEQRT